MQHLAIMKKSWGLTSKILSGEKKIESRWYKSKYPPWNRVKRNEFVYFKDSGEPVKIKTEVSKVLQFDSLNQRKVKKILHKFYVKDGIEHDKFDSFFKLFKDKKYCILIFLKNPREIEPFEINKKGFGLMSAWICVEDINKIRRR